MFHRCLCALLVISCEMGVAGGQEPSEWDPTKLTLEESLEHLASIEPQVRAMGARGLGQQGASAAGEVPVLCHALTDNVEVVSAALDALIQITEADGSSALRLRPASPRIVELLSAGELRDTYRASKLLARLARHAPETPSAIRRGIERIPKGRLHRLVAFEVVNLLSSLGEPGLEELIRASRSDHECLARFATEKIGEFPCQSENTISMLAGLLKWGTPTVRRAALTALAKGGPRASRFAEHIAQAAGDPETARDAVAAILEIPCDDKVRVTALVAGYYQSCDYETRFKSIRALRGYPQDRRALNAELDAIWDGRWLFVQLAAIENLRAFPDAASWSSRLVEILDIADEDWIGSGGWELQVAAASTLVAVGQRQQAAFPFLLKAVGERDDKYQHDDFSQDWSFSPAKAAADGLGWLERGSPMALRALPLLQRRMKELELGSTADLATAIFALHPDRIMATAKLCAFMESIPALGPLALENARICRWLASHKHNDLALEFLIRSLETGRPLSPWWAAGVLSEMGPRARPALAALEASLESDDEDIRAAAAQAIDRIHGEQRSQPELASSVPLSP